MKPREKIIQSGAQSLKNAELLAILLGIGSKKESVFNLSRRLIAEYGNNAFHSIANVEQIKNLWNISTVHACKIAALIELGKRLFEKNFKKPIFQNPKTAARHLADMRTYTKEVFRVLYLSTQNKLIADEVISVGSLDISIAHPREVFKPALLHNAASIIVAHNHPSGDPFPSEEDMKITENLRNIGKMMKIPVLDHLIIGDRYFFSFEEGEKRKLKSLDQS